MNNVQVLTVIDAMNIAIKYSGVSPKDSRGLKAITSEECLIKTLRCDFLVHLDYGTFHKMFLVSKVPYDDLFKYNSQFTYEYYTRYLFESQTAITEIRNKDFKKTLLIRNRRAIKRNNNFTKDTK